MGWEGSFFKDSLVFYKNSTLLLNVSNKIMSRNLLEVREEQNIEQVKEIRELSDNSESDLEYILILIYFIPCIFLRFICYIF